jgi:hypothetical protein
MRCAICVWPSTGQPLADTGRPGRLARSQRTRARSARQDIVDDPVCEDGDLSRSARGRFLLRKAARQEREALGHVRVFLVRMERQLDGWPKKHLRETEYQPDAEPFLEASQ